MSLQYPSTLIHHCVVYLVLPPALDGLLVSIQVLSMLLQNHLWSRNAAIVLTVHRFEQKEYIEIKTFDTSTLYILGTCYGGVDKIFRFK